MENAVTKTEYARQKGLNKSTITRWAASGRLVLDDGGRVLVAESEARLAETADPSREGVVEHHANNRGTRSGGSPADPARDSHYTKRIGESARREAAMADIAEMERDEKLGRLVERSKVELALADSIVSARQALERIPDRLMIQLAAETDPDKIHALLSREIASVCQQIAEFTQRLPDALGSTPQ